MSLWGNADSAAITGNVDVDNGSATVAEGSVSTAFLTAGQIDVGDLMMIVDVPYRVKSIESAASLTLTENYAGTSADNLTVLKRETPRNLTVSDSDAIFGVSTTTNVEHTGGTDNIVSVAVDSGGSGYINAGDAVVTIPAPASGTQATATAVVTAGKVTSITITDVGAGYVDTDSIAVTIHAATNATFNANAATSANDRITLTADQVTALAVNDAVTYTIGSGNTEDIGLTTATVYYIHSKPTSTTVTLKTSVDSLDAIDLTTGSSETGHGLQGATGSAVATRGSGSGNNVVHPGWIKRTVGTGGRAGRIHYETLVAMSSITGDTVDDVEFPE